MTTEFIISNTVASDTKFRNRMWKGKIQIGLDNSSKA